MRKARTPEGIRLRELLNEGPIRRSEMQAQLEQCISHHRALTYTVSQIRNRGSASPYRAVEQQIASGQRDKARATITGALRWGAVKETIDDNGDKWLSWA